MCNTILNKTLRSSDNNVFMGSFFLRSACSITQWTFQTSYVQLTAFQGCSVLRKCTHLEIVSVSIELVGNDPFSGPGCAERLAKYAQSDCVIARFCTLYPPFLNHVRSTCGEEQLGYKNGIIFLGTN